MLVHAQRIGSADQHDEGEHVPLDFEPAVGAVVQGVTDHRVTGADEAADEHEITGDLAQDLARRIYQRTYF